MSRKIFLIAIILLFYFRYKSQNIGINTSGVNADPSAALDVVSTNKGLLIPRVALTSLNSALPIVSPLTSLMVYNTATAGAIPNNVVPGYYYWDGAKWVSVSGAVSGGLNWNVLGNAGTNTGTNFLGTTDAQDLVFKTNSSEKMRVLVNGRVGLGTNAPNSLLSLETNGNSGLTLSENVSTYPNGGDFSFYSTGNSHPAYAQFIQTNWKYALAQNQYATNAGASRILFLNKDFIGFQGVGNVNAGDIVLQNAPTGVAGTSIPYANTMALKANGYVGIGNLSPRGKFDVLNGDAFVADNVYAQNSFNLGRSANNIFCDNLTPYTDNGFRVYDANSASHIHFEALNTGVLQAYGTSGALANNLEASGTESDLSLNPYGANVGIGTTNPYSKLEVFEGAGNSEVRISSGTPVKYGELIFSASNPGYLNRGASIEGNGEGTGIDVGALVFKTQYGVSARTERMRINSSGDIGIGTNAPGARLHINTSLTNPLVLQSGAISITQYLGTNFAGYNNPVGIFYSEIPGSETHMFGGEIIPDSDANWNVGAPTRRWNTIYATNGVINTSDARLKQDIVPSNYGLNEVLKLKPVSYNWIKSENNGNNKKLGFIAQDVEKILPEVVYKPKTDKEFYGINYADMVPVLTKAIQEQNTIIVDLKRVVEDMQKKIESLEKK